MTYTNAPYTGVLFRNERKTKENQPDYKGNYYEPLGDGVVEREIVAWVRKGKSSGKEYLSLKVGDKFVPSRIGPPLEPPAKEEPPLFDRDVPF